MKTQSILQISGMILLAVVVSLAVLALLYTIRNPAILGILATVSWNS